MKNEKPGFLVKKSGFARTFMFLFYAVFLLLLAGIIGGLLMFKDSSKTKQNKSGYDFDGYFQGCTLLNGNCLGESCVQRTYCSDKKYKMCRIYDCKDSFGIGTEDESGKIDVRKSLKPSAEKVMKKVADCKGELEISEKNCADKTMEIKAKVATTGNCPVSNFRLFYKEAGFRTSKFSSVGDNQYLITSSYCADLEKIVAVGEGGTTIAEKKF